MIVADASAIMAWLLRLRSVPFRLRSMFTFLI